MLDITIEKIQDQLAGDRKRKLKHKTLKVFITWIKIEKLNENIIKRVFQTTCYNSLAANRPSEEKNRKDFIRTIS